MENTTQDLLQRPQILYDSASPSTSNSINNTAALLETSENNNNNNNYKIELTEEEKDYFSNMPLGYRFCPYDEELIIDYLRNKVENKPLPYSRIIDVNVYQYNPEILTEKFAKFGEDGEYFFFTSRNKKYRNGSRPDRVAGDGYWKATGADKEIKSNGVVVGWRKALVFYQGKPICSEKTDWIMQEYCLLNPPQVTKTNKDDMKLDDRVLCRIYRTPYRFVKQKRKRDENNTKSRNLKYNSENNMSLSVDQLTGMIQISTPSVDQNNEGLMRMSQISTPSVVQNNEGLMGVTQASTPSANQNNEGLMGMNQISTPSVDQNNEGLMGVTQVSTLSVDQNNEGLIGMIQISTTSVDQNNEGFMGVTQVSTPSADQNNEGLTRMIQISTPSVDENNKRLIGMITTHYNEGFMGMMETSTSIGMFMSDDNQYLYMDDDQHMYQHILYDPTPHNSTFFDNTDQNFINNVLNANVFLADQPLNQYNTLLPCFCGQNQCMHPRYYIR